MKQTMAKYANGLDTTQISNDSIGYVLRRFGLSDKFHTADGNHYNMSRNDVEAIFSHEGLKP